MQINELVNSYFNEYPIKTCCLDGFNATDETLLEYFGANSSDLVWVKESHSDKVVSAFHSASGCLGSADGIITNIPGKILCIGAADCVPVYLYDPCYQVVGMVHSGRKGTQNHIIRKAVELMTIGYGCSLGNIRILLGPHISKRNYEVDASCRDDFISSYGENVASCFFEQCGDDRYLLDLGAAITQSAVAAGVPLKNIQDVNICTFEEETFSSYRRYVKNGSQGKCPDNVFAISIPKRHDDDIKEAIRLCNEVRNESRKNGYGGTDKPGLLAMKICPDLIKKTSAGMDTILVAGTNGKTTTCRMLNHIFKEQGINCTTNPEGANQLGGVLTAFIVNSDSNGNPKNKTAIIECDERLGIWAAKTLKPSVIILTNISDDQPYRFRNIQEVVKMTHNMFLQCPDADICINSDDALSLQIAMQLPNRIHYYHADKEYIYFDDNKASITLGQHGLGYRYDAAAACLTAVLKGCYREASLRHLENVKPAFARMESFVTGGKKVTLELMKNPANLMIIKEYLMSSGKKDLLILSTYDEREILWYKDADFSFLQECFDRIIVCGNQKQESVRNFISCLDADYISEDELINTINKTDTDIFMLLEYSAMMRTRKILSQAGLLMNYWEQ